jgi:hypothetical protein
MSGSHLNFFLNSVRHYKYLIKAKKLNQLSAFYVSIIMSLLHNFAVVPLELTVEMKGWRK